MIADDFIIVWELAISVYIIVWELAKKLDDYLSFTDFPIIYRELSKYTNSDFSTGAYSWNGKGAAFGK